LHFGDGREEHIDSANDMYYNSKVMYRNNPNSNNAERYEEYEANQFAAALLMDAELIRYSWPRLKSIDLMADFFKVSSSAMEIRLKTLHLL
jgi:Zn-dependent peptidase ImmA (M78 family)